MRTGTGLAGVTTLVSDHHGTAELAVHNTTNVLTRRRHDPFGKPRGPVPAWPGDHGFLDKPAGATGLTHIGARQYDPAIGRFTSVDPVMDLADPQQWHGYAYANNNPVTWSDPKGLMIEGGPGWQCQWCNDGYTAKEKNQIIQGLTSNSDKRRKATIDVINHRTQSKIPGWGKRTDYLSLAIRSARAAVRRTAADVARWAGERAYDVWDRGSTAAVYTWDAGVRQISNPRQTAKDLLSGGGLGVLAERLSAYEAILVEDGELKRDGPYCGREAECITGVSAAPGDFTAVTIGHTIRFEKEDPEAKLIAHEMQHAYDVENVGFVPFYASYLIQAPFTGYDGIVWEERGRAVQTGYASGVRPRGLPWGPG